MSFRKFLPEDDRRAIEEAEELTQRREENHYKNLLNAQRFLAQTPAPAEVPSIYDQIDWDPYGDGHGIEEKTGLTGIRSSIDQAKLRAYGGDGYYLNPDGTTNVQRMHNDQFLVDVERVYHENRGTIPLSWLLEFPDDLHLLGDSEAASAIYNLSLAHQQLRSAEIAQEAERQAYRERAMKLYDMGEAGVREMEAILEQNLAEARTRIASLDVRQAEEIMGDRDYGGGLLGSIREGLDTNDPEGIARDRAERNGTTYDEEIIKMAETKLLQEARYAPNLPDTPGNSWIENVNPFAALTDEGGQHFYDVITGKNFTLQAQLVESAYGSFGGLAMGFGAMGSAIGWFADETAQALTFDQVEDPLGDWLETFERGYNVLFDEFNVVQARNDAEAELRRLVGMEDPELVLSMSALPILDGWNQLPQASPDEYNTLMAMANGNEEIARTLYGDMVLNSEEYRAWVEEQARITREAAVYQLEEMENADYTVGNVVLDMIALWGEGTEMAATAVSLAAKDLFAGPHTKESADAVGSFWQRVRDHDVPSSVFGLEGTAFGLVIDVLLPAGIDPNTIAFAPTLSPFRRAGSTTLTQIVDNVDAPSSTMVRGHAADVIQGSRTSAVGVQTAFDNLASTGHLDEYQHAAGGFGRPLSPHRPYLERYHGVVDDVPISTIDEMLGPEGPRMSELLDPDGEFPHVHADLDAIGDDIERIRTYGPDKPIEVTVNPRTGAAVVTGGDDILRAYRAAEGVKSAPVTFKIDTDFGVQRVHPDGLFDPEDAARLDEVAQGRRSSSDEVVTGSDEDIRVATLNSASGLDSLGRFDYLGTWTNPRNGQKFNIKKMGDADGPAMYWLTDENRQVVAAVSRSADGDLRYGTLKDETADFTGQGLQEQLFRTAHGEGDKLLLTTGQSGSMSDDALGLTSSLARKFLDEAKLVADDSFRVHNWVIAPDGDDLRRIGNEDFVRPRKLLPQELKYGEADLDLMRQIEIEHQLLGGDPISGNRTPVSVALGTAVRDQLRQQRGVGQWIDAHITPINGSANIHFTGPAAQSNVNQFVARLWGSVNDMDSYNTYSTRILDFWERRGNMKAQNRRAALQIEALRQQLRGVEAHLGRSGMWDELTGVSDEALQAQRSWDSELRRQAREIENQIRQIRDQRVALSRGVADYSDLNKILKEMEEDFNRRHIATNPAWKEFVDEETGLVDWSRIQGRGEPNITSRLERAAKKAEDQGITLEEALRGEEGYMPQAIKEMLDLIDRAGFDIDLARFNQQVNHNLSAQTVFHASASPLEMMVAAFSSPNEVAKLGRRIQQTGVREAVGMTHMLWMVDKVLTPRTGIVVSLDEMMRIWHKGGYASAFQYLEDKVMNATRKVTRATNSPRFNQLPQRWQDRILGLEQYPIFYRQLERSFMELHGYGFDVIEFKKGKLPRDNVPYYEAAQRQAGQSLSEDVWQAYFRGEDAFREWFETAPEAGVLRDTDFFNAGTLERQGLPMWKDVYDGIHTTFEQWYLSGIAEGKKGAARKIWKEAAEQASELGSTAAGNVQLPRWVLEGFGSVTGNARMPNANPVLRGIDWVSERLFQRPVNYRRGFVAEMVRKSEWRRLEKLMKNSGIRIISNAELDSIIRRRYPGLNDNAITTSRRGIAQDLYENENVITEQYLREVVENKVVAEMEHMLYSFHMTSKAGRAAKGVFPFGKPWADMYGFWGREMMTRPQLRGWINNANYLNINRYANRLVDNLPFNPKPAALVSRLAATEFEMENIQDDPLLGPIARKLGLDTLDVSGAMFLPTGGQSPFMTMIPGLGMIPTAVMHMIFEKAGPDPVEDPLAWQQWADQWSQFLPGMGYNRPQDVGDLLEQTVVGGGLISRIGGMVGSLDMIMGTNMTQSADPITGSWRTGIAYDRQVKVAMSDPAFWEEMEEVLGMDMDMADLSMEAIVDEWLKDIQSEQAAAVGGQMFTEQALELRAPVTVRTLTQSDDLIDVWIDNVTAIPGAEDILKRYDLTSEEQRGEAADAIRSYFFQDIEDWQQDTIIAENPQVAVNAVGMWKWTDKAKAQQVEGAELPYHTGGSTESLARHETYITLGYVQPKSPREVMVGVLGRVLSARVNTASDLYNGVATTVNDWRWEAMDHEDWDGWKDWLQGIATYGNDEGWWPWDSARDVWDNWDKANEIMLFNGYHDTEELDDGTVVPKPITMPGAIQRWGEQLPADYSSLREEYREGFPIPNELIGEKEREQMRALGMDIGAEFQDPEDGHTATIEMSAVYWAVKDSIAKNYLDNPVYALISDEYLAERMPNGAAVQATTTILGRTLDHSDVTPQARYTHTKTLLYAGEALARKNEGDDSWLEMAEIARQGWRAMGQDDMLNKLPLDQLWNDAYGRSLGPIDWQADEPVPLVLEFDDEGQAVEINPNAQRVLVQKVVDGDTLHIRQSPGHNLFGQHIPSGVQAIRMLGVNAAELGTEDGEVERQMLEDKVDAALEQGLPIYIVRDPDRYGNTDMFGRIFAWVYIGDEAFTRPETMIPRG